VGCEGPEDVLLATDLAEAQPPGIDILEATDGALADQAFQAADGRMILEDVTDEEATSRSLLPNRLGRRRRDR